jgi:hypothetical protein
MPRKDATALSTSNAQAQQDAVSEGIDAYELPKSLVTRLARSAVRFALCSINTRMTHFYSFQKMQNSKRMWYWH